MFKVFLMNILILFSIKLKWNVINFIAFVTIIFFVFSDDAICVNWIFCQWISGKENKKNCVHWRKSILYTLELNPSEIKLLVHIIYTSQEPFTLMLFKLLVEELGTNICPKDFFLHIFFWNVFNDLQISRKISRYVERILRYQKIS